MGVPTLTVMGATPVRRFGASIQAHLGLDEFIAKDAEDFVRKGVRIAKKIDRLAALRAGMRQRFRDCPAGQPATVASAFSRATRVMWQRWCAGLPPEPFKVD
jgi:predicted O-linked N-acetylglucosamine transferase (SPINDLY family)